MGSVNSWNKRIQVALRERSQQQLFRQRVLLDSAQQVYCQRNGQPVVSFCSNDYLGLAAHGDDLIQAAKKWGLGSGASHLVCGHSNAHHALEKALAAHCGYERALLFSNGFMANMGVISALARRGDEVFQDKLNHASLLDGAILSRAQLRRFRHTDYANLQQQLETSVSKGERLIVSDSIFSMDGDLSDVPHLSALSREYNALLLIDDAHGFGVLGSNQNGNVQYGQGVRAHFGLSPQQLPLYIGTLGKALGGMGAFVAASAEVIDYLIQFSRPYIYTTALPPAIAEAMLANLKRLQRGDRQSRLNDNIAYFKSQAKSLGLPLMPSNSAIQPLLVGDNARALRISEQLLHQRLWVSAIRPPTVPVGKARLRITLSAAHSKADINHLVSVLSDLLPAEHNLKYIESKEA